MFAFGAGPSAGRQQQQPQSEQQRAEAVKELGNQYFRAGQYDRALEQYSAAIALDPHNHVLYSNRSLAYSAQGKWEDALREADSALRYKRDSEKAHYRRGVALHALGRVADAVSAFQECVRLVPGSGEFKAALEAAKTELKNGGGSTTGGGAAAAKAFQAALMANAEYPLASYKARVLRALAQCNVFSAGAQAQSQGRIDVDDPLGARTAGGGAAAAARGGGGGRALELLDIIIAGYVGEPMCVVVCAERNSTVHVRDPDTGDATHQLSGHNDLVNCVALLPNPSGPPAPSSGSGSGSGSGFGMGLGMGGFGSSGPQVVTAGEDKRVKVWNVKTTVCTHTLDGHTQAITCLAVLPSGRLVVTGSRDGTLRVWDLTTRREKCQLKGGHASTTDSSGGNGITAVCALSDVRIVSGGGSLDRALCVWDIDSPYSAMCKQNDAHTELTGVSSLTPLPCAASYGAYGLALGGSSISASSSGSGNNGSGAVSPTVPAASPLSRGTSTASTDSSTDVVSDVSALFGGGGSDGTRSPSPPVGADGGAVGGGGAARAAVPAKPLAPAIPTDTFASCSAWSCVVKIWQYHAPKRALHCISTIVESAPVHRVNMLFPLGVLALSCTHGAVQLWSVRHAHPNTGGPATGSGSGSGSKSSASSWSSSSSGVAGSSAANAPRKHGSLYGHRNIAYSVAVLPDGTVATGTTNSLMLWSVPPPAPLQQRQLPAPPSLADAAGAAEAKANSAAVVGAAAAEPAAAPVVIECLASHRSRPGSNAAFGCVVDMAVVPVW